MHTARVHSKLAGRKSDAENILENNYPDPYPFPGKAGIAFFPFSKERFANVLLKKSLQVKLGATGLLCNPSKLRG
jgi:hypothetical protein